jgi:NTP pyrophosphatase (non-canonical NTP hydrolase)
MSEIKKFQDEVGKWVNEAFNKKRGHNKKACTIGTINHFQKEALELKQASQDYINGHQGKEIIPEEAADCLILLLHLAHLHEFDLLEWTEKKMVVNYKRTWGEPDEFGVIEHIK